jgi:hypothetical protein
MKEHLKNRRSAFQWWREVENKELISQKHFKKSHQFLTGREIEIIWKKTI